MRKKTLYLHRVSSHGSLPGILSTPVGDSVCSKGLQESFRDRKGGRDRSVYLLEKSALPTLLLVFGSSVRATSKLMLRQGLDIRNRLP